MRNNNDETVNWMSEIVKNMAEVDSIAPWSDDTLCALTGSQPPVTQKDILSTTTTDKALTVLMSKIEKGFPETKAELEQEIQPYWRVKDMLTVYFAQTNLKGVCHCMGQKRTRLGSSCDHQQSFVHNCFIWSQELIQGSRLPDGRF